MTPLPTPIADFDHPLDILDGCHQRIRRQCEYIEKIAAHLERYGPDEEARQACLGVIRYFEDAGRKHHRDEDQDLFPMLERAVSPADRETLLALLTKLRIEHEEIEERWAVMRDRLAGVADGSVRRLVPETAAAFTAAYERHITTEEQELLPLARRILDRASVLRLGQAMARRRGVASRSAA